MKKVLILTYYWPPSGGAGVQRWLKFTKYLPQYGWEPIIYTAENPETPALDQSLLKDIPDGTEVHKKAIWEPMNAYRKFTGRKSSEKFGAGFLSESKAPKFRDQLAIWIRGNLFIPDAKRFWIQPSYRYLKKYLRKNKVDVIITTGPPHSVHVIGLKLKRKFNIPWVADFRDPWTDIDFYRSLQLSKHADRKHHRLEQKVLDSADLVIPIGNHMSDSFAEKTKSKQVVIPNGYDEEDVPACEEKAHSDKFTITHLGSINGDRNHMILWKAIKKIIHDNPTFSKSFELHLIGKLDHSISTNIKEYGLEQWIKITTYIPHSDVIRKLQNSSVLLLPLNNTPNAKGILTGKVFEYFAAKRPIIAIGPEDGDLGQMLRTTQTGTIVDFDNLEGLVDIIKEMFQKHQNNQLFVHAKGIENESRKNLTAKLVTELDQLIQKNNSSQKEE